MDKRKVCVFLILVGIAVVCVCVLMYTLFYAIPHSNSTIQNSKHSLVQRVPQPFPSTLGEVRLVRS
jgi:type IV secretory pathway VirB3-like protein